MAGEGDKSKDFYGVLGLKKECTVAELKHAYKKLALKWHPDRFSASGNSKYVEEAKKKFQAIQKAYSGVYDCDDDDDEKGMGDFLNEMVAMMTETKPDENRNETFEELQELFDDMFHSDIESFGGTCRSATPTRSSSSQGSCSGSYSISNKRNSTESSSGNSRDEPTPFQGFCIGTSGKHPGSDGESSRRKNMRKGRRW